MHVTGTIWALDLARCCGWAVGLPGSQPRAGSKVLKTPGAPPAAAYGSLMAWLGGEWFAETPALVVKEAALPLAAYPKLESAAHTVAFTHGLHAIVEGLAHRFGVPVVSAHDATVRKYFLGSGRMGTRRATKRAVVDRCHMLDLMPRDCRDEDMADALAVWSWADAVHGSRSARVLHLFAEKVA